MRVPKSTSPLHARVAIIYTPFSIRTSGFILDPPTIPDRCGASERGGIASQLWVVGCNPLFETRFSGCFPACKGPQVPKSSKNREKRAVRPHILGFSRIFSILLPPGMLVAVKNSGFAGYNAVSCAFPFLLRRCMPSLPSLRRLHSNVRALGTTHGLYSIV